MAQRDRAGGEGSAGAAAFATTHWSTVLAAGDSTSPEASEALERLCRTYWYPLYAFVRAKRYCAQDAEDLTQAFFERFLRKRYLKVVAHEKGRFRTFLLTLLQRFLYNEFDRATAAKRGGGIPAFPLDILEAEGRFTPLAPDRSSPELTFARAWAETVIRSGLDRLRTAYAAHAKGSLFEELKVYLSQPAHRAAYAEVASRLGMTVDAVLRSVTRLRRRYRAMVREEVANTVATPAEIDEEMHYLVELLTR